MSDGTPFWISQKLKLYGVRTKAWRFMAASYVYNVRAPMTPAASTTSGLALAVVVWIGASGTAAGQSTPPDHDHAQPPPSADAQQPAGAGEYPSLHISGFA